MVNNQLTLTANAIARKPRKPKFTEKERAFCEAYVTNGFNAKAAAKTAGYAMLPYEILQKPKIRAKINSLLEAALRAKGVSKEKLMVDLKTIVSGNMSDIVTVSDGNVSLKDNLGNKGELIRRIAVKKDGTVAVDLHDRVRAAEVLLKVLGAEAPKQVAIKVGPDSEAFREWERTQARIASNTLENTIIDVEIEEVDDEETEKI